MELSSLSSSCQSYSKAGISEIEESSIWNAAGKYNSALGNAILNEYHGEGKKEDATKRSRLARLPRKYIGV